MKFKVKNPNPRTHGKSLYRAPEYITIETLPSGKLDAFETWEPLNADLDGYGAGLTYHTLREAVHGDVMTWESGQSIRVME